MGGFGDGLLNEANLIPPEPTFVAILISRDPNRSRSWS